MTDVGTPPAPSQRPALSILLDLEFPAAAGGAAGPVLEHLREVVDGVVGRTEEIAGSLPRLSFWRRKES